VGLPQTTAEPQASSCGGSGEGSPLYRERYFDFNVQHFHEKLREQHGLNYSYTWVKTALQEAGLVERRRKWL
jgi:hypothetical protein